MAAYFGHMKIWILHLIVEDKEIADDLTGAMNGHARLIPEDDKPEEEPPAEPSAEPSAEPPAEPAEEAEVEEKKPEE